MKVRLENYERPQRPQHDEPYEPERCAALHSEVGPHLHLKPDTCPQTPSRVRPTASRSQGSEALHRAGVYGGEEWEHNEDDARAEPRCVSEESELEQRQGGVYANEQEIGGD